MSDEQARRAEQSVGAIGLVRPLEEAAPPKAPTPDETWYFGEHLNPDDKGQPDYVPVYQATAWVYYATEHTGLVRPVLMADGFDSGHSDLDYLYNGFERGEYPLISELHRLGRDVIIFGYGRRDASILENAGFAIEAVMKTIAERQGDAPLAVGGFSMGGLVTRYALAKLESEGIDHQTATYFSYDTPHRGAWVPICLQAFAHYLKQVNPANSALSDQINSPASRQLLWRHIETVQDTPGQDEARTEFLGALEQVGNWPARPRKIAVANGRGDGTGNGVEAGVVALRSTGLIFPGTTLYTQDEGDGVLVAELKANFGRNETVTTDGLPRIDGAPGGTLSSFGIAANTLSQIPLGNAQAPVPTICFVPSVSAVAIGDLDTTEELTVDINALDPSQSELDDFLCASGNEEHTKITEELCSWILDRLL